MSHPTHPAGDSARVTAGEPLGTRIRRLRMARGWTQRELAEPRYDRGFLAKVESGQRSPSEAALGYLAERLGLAAEDLRFGRPPGLARQLWDELDDAYRLLEQGGLDQAEIRFSRAEVSAAYFHLPDIECYARFCLAETRWQRFDIAGATTGFEHAERIAADAPPWLRAMIVHRWSACQYLAGSVTTAVAHVEAALGELRAGDEVDPDAELALLTALIHPLVEMGDLRRARRATEHGQRVAASATRVDFVARFHRQATQLWQAIGRTDRADAEVTEALRLFGSLGFERDAARCRWARGFLLRESGRLAEARAELAAARDTLAEVDSREGVIGSTVELAEVCRRLGALDEAEALVRDIHPLLRGTADLESRVEADRLLGLIAQARGDLPGAERLLRRAAGEQERAALRAGLVTTSLHLGNVLRTQGKADEAIEAYLLGVRAAGRP
ncbi:helix-turn-helix domain-containing protein [Amycolatopsis nigrescens]|uniref:helix-turn-helix domain-containing protein n=1 Tax=Amycolatopsis nigrescens TaxID=381445 RepID=UPI0006841A52|nr:helix-turn-helix transcriptional regulator [Amycolatopsis nigrescens]